MAAAICVILFVALLAFANGANDNSKGVATLVGYGHATPRQALIWAAATTAVGAAISFCFASGLVKTFSTDLFPSGADLSGGFFAAVILGAFGWVILATLTGLPISTTHAIAGALIGAGLVSSGVDALRWSLLLTKFALPLALSPLAAMAVVYVLASPVRWAVRRYQDRCVCVAAQAAARGDEGEVAVAQTGATVITGTERECQAAGTVAVASGAKAAALLHWTSGGMVGFARGWNDCPKIAALAVGATAAAGIEHGTLMAFGVVTAAMAFGGLLAARRVLTTMAQKLTPLPLAESLTASMSTASMVAAASWLGLPVSTTHVSTGAIIGAGLKNDPRQVRWGKVTEVVASWVLTLPAAATLSAIVCRVIG